MSFFFYKSFYVKTLSIKFRNVINPRVPVLPNLCLPGCIKRSRREINTLEWADR